MGSDRKAFDEVKALLNKLDRSIDEARHRRLGPDDEPEAAAEDPAETPREDRNATVIGRPSGGPSKPSNAARPRRGAQYGRAKPIGPGNENPKPGDKNAWKGAGAEDDRLIG